ncbi:hypothetical protein WG66_006086 [Moniliophthora roreri]|nr:hypothetical protein WG66_006086 [Moniliophthora roreri]
MILLYALSRSLPPSTFATSTNTSSLFDPVTGDCIDINGCRTTTGILWSCLSVILICTWVAIHPNIPKVGTHSAVVVYKNIELMAIAILGPEIMILWAMRQWYSAKKIAEQYKDYGWGMSHAFFVIMGGFALYDGDRFMGHLWNDSDDVYWRDKDEIKKYIQKVQGVAVPDMSQDSDSLTVDSRPQSTYLLEYLITNGYITITEDEIKDRSHADFIAKSIALIQTTWFILQVAARAAEGLTITELEVITVGFALLNFGTYFLWWNKPLRVRYPVRVTWQQRKLDASQLKEHDRGCVKTVQEGFTKTLAYICNESSADEGPLAIQLVFLPLWMTWNIIIQCQGLLDDDFAPQEFSTRLAWDPLQLYIIVYSIAAAFGAIHCIPWAFQFPTHTEQLLWRICAIAVAAAPIAMGCVHWWLKELRLHPKQSSGQLLFLTLADTAVRISNIIIRI